MVNICKSQWSGEHVALQMDFKLSIRDIFPTIVIYKSRQFVADFDLVQSSSFSQNLTLLYSVLAWLEMACYRYGFFLFCSIWCAKGNSKVKRRHCSSFPKSWTPVNKKETSTNLWPTSCGSDTSL